MLEAAEFSWTAGAQQLGVADFVDDMREDVAALFGLLGQRADFRYHGPRALDQLVGRRDAETSNRSNRHLGWNLRFPPGQNAPCGGPRTIENRGRYRRQRGARHVIALGSPHRNSGRDMPGDLAGDLRDAGVGAGRSAESDSGGGMPENRERPASRNRYP